MNKLSKHPNLYNQKQLTIIVAIISVCLMLAAYLYMHAEKKRVTTSKINELETINNFKATQIDDWLSERIADARHFSSSPLYADALKKLLQNPDTSQQRKIGERNELIRKLRGFKDVQIAINHNLLPYSTLKRDAKIPQEIYPLIDSVLQHNAIVLSSFLTDSLTKELYLVEISPIPDKHGEPFATLIFYIDPNTYLFRLLNFSADDYITRKTILYTDSPMGLRTINTTDSADYQPYYATLQQDKGSYIGAFTKQTNIIAYHQAITHAPWKLVTIQETREAYSQYYSSSMTVIAFALMITLFAAFGISWMYQNHEKKTFKSLLEKEQLAVTQFQKSEAKFRAVIETSNDAILFINTNGLITYCGKAIKKITGHDTNEIVDHPLNEILCSDFTEIIQPSFLTQKEDRVHLCKIKTKNNGQHWIEVTLSNQLNNPHLKTIVANIRDIQERKLHEIQIDQLINFQSAILDNAGYAIITTDTTGIITLFNKEAERILKYTSEELVGKATPEIFHKKDEIVQQARLLSEKLNIPVSPSFEAFTIEASLGQPTRYDWSYISKLGEIIPVSLKITALYNNEGHINGYMGIAVDLTELKSAETNLRISEQKFSYFYNLSPDIAGITRLEDGLFMDVNSAFTKILGYEPHEIVGKTAFDMGLWVNKNQRETLKSLVSTNDEALNYEFQTRTKAGKIVDALFSARRFIYNNEECMLFVIKDITERKIAADEIVRNEARLRSMVNILQYPNADSTSFLDFVLEEALKISQSDIGYIYNYDEKAEVFSLNSWSKNVMAECSVINPMTCYELGKTGLWGEVVRQRQAIIFNDYPHEHPLKKGYPEGHVELTRFLSIPIFSHNEIVAVIGVANKNTDYNSSDVLQLTLLMDAAWKVIEGRKAQLDLLASEEKYRKLFENMTSGFAFHKVIFNPAKEAIDMKYIDVNTRFKEIWNISNEIVGKTLYQTYPQIDRSWVKNTYNTLSHNIFSKEIVYITEIQRHLETTFFKVDNDHIAALFDDVTDRVKAEVALKESETRFRSIVENIPIGLGVLDMNGTIKYQNPTVQSYLGYDITETPTVNEWFEKVFPDESYRTMAFAQWEEDIENLKQQNKSSALPKTYTMQSKQGEHLEIELSYAILSDEIYTLFNNITETVKAEQALYISETQYQMLFNSLPSGLALHQLIYDDNKKAINLRFIDVNPAFESIIGKRGEDIKGKLLTEAFPDVYDLELVKKMESISENGAIANFTDYAEFIDKYIHWTFFSYQKGIVVGILNDVSEMVRTQNELKLSQQKFQDIYTLIPDAIIISRLTDGTIIDANPSYAELTGYSHDEFTNKTTLDLDLWLSNDTRNEFFQRFEWSGTVSNFEAEMKTKSNHIFNCLVSAKAIEYMGDKCILSVIHNITDLKASQKALLNEQAFTNALLDSIPGLVYMYDENGLLVRWNNKHITDTGFSPEELHNKSIMSWYDEPNQLIIKNGLQQIFDTGLGEAEALLTLKNNSQRLYYFSATSVMIDEKFYIAGIGLDVTERKAANETLKQVEQRFENIFNLTPDMVGITRLSDGVILSVNPTATSLTGYSFDELIGKSTLELNLWADKNTRDEMVRRIKEDGQVTNLETGMLLKDGTILTCLFSARPLLYENQNCILFVVHNITERKKAEEQLKTNQARLRKAQSIGRLGYSEQIIGSQEIWASAEGKRIFGFEAVDGTIPVQLIIPCYSDIQQIREATNRLITQGEKFDLEFYITPADGTDQKCLHAIQEIDFDENNRPFKLITIFQDITDRKKIENEIRHLNENLEKLVDERTSQLAKVNKDLESFAYSVSHDLRAPLRHIDGFTKLLYNQISTPSPLINNYFQKINTSSQRMSSMIDDLLTFSRLGRKELVLAEVKPNDIINEIIEQLAPDIASRNIRWTIHQLSIVNGDRNLLKIAFENLIHNAIKYSRNKEVSEIEIGESEENESLTTFYIKDNGVGFNMAYADKLFGVFQRLHTNEEFEGTGIGLANVKQIISKHGGTIKAEGIIDEGATFFINLPKIS